MAEQDDIRISQYWDALVAGKPDAVDIDRSIAEPLRHVHTLFTAPKPGSARERARQRVFDSSTTSEENTMTAIPLPIPFPSLDGKDRKESASWRPEIGLRRKRARWAVASLAAALVILLAGIGGYLVYDNRSDQPVVLQPATPETTPGSGWTNYKGNAALTGEGNAGPVGKPVGLWRFRAGGPCEASPVALGGVVYAACTDGFLYVLDATNGEELWRFDAGRPLGSATVTEDHVYVVSGSGALFAIGLDERQEAWRFESPVWGTGVVNNGLLAVPAQNGWLVGLDAETGAERWRYQVTDQGTVNHPAIANGIVYAGGAGGGIVAVDAATGELRWRGDTGTGPTGSAVVADGIAYIGVVPAAGGQLFAFDAESGEPLWVSAEPMYSPAVSNGATYSGSDEGIVHAFDSATGEELWRTQVEGRANSPVVAGEVVYAPSSGDLADYVHALDAATGAELWRFELDGDVAFTGALTDGVMYISTMDGSVYAIGGTDEDVILAPGGQESPADPAAATPVAGRADSPVELLWHSTGGADPLIAGFDGAIGPDGNLWVIDACNSRFQIFDPDGTFLEFWGDPGSGPGQFNFCGGEFPAGAFAFDSQGNLYVADAYNSRIQKFDRERKFVTKWGEFGSGDGQFLETSGIAVSSEGSVVVCDVNRADCQVFDPEGQFLFSLGGRGAGEPILSRPAHVASDADGSVYVSDLGHNQVFKFDSDGTLLQTVGEPGFGPGQFFGLEDVAVDGAGTIFVSEPENGRVVMLDAQGNYLTEWNGSSTPADQFVPLGVTVDDDGGLYVFHATPEGSTVYKFRLLPPLGPVSTPAT